MIVGYDPNYPNDDGEDGDLMATLLAGQGRWDELLEFAASRKGKVSYCGEVSDHWIEEAIEMTDKIKAVAEVETRQLIEEMKKALDSAANDYYARSHFKYGDEAAKLSARAETWLGQKTKAE